MVYLLIRNITNNPRGVSEMSIKEPITSLNHLAITRELLTGLLTASIIKLDDFLFTKMCNVLLDATITMTYKKDDDVIIAPPEYTIHYHQE